MKKVLLILLLFSYQCYSQVDGVLKRAVLPVVKISPKPDESGMRYKVPCGTALLVKDEKSFPGRLFLVTAKHVIEKDLFTDCMINFSKTSDSKKEIVSSVKKYAISKREWRFHQGDRKVVAGSDTTFYTFDIAIAEIFIQRIKIDGEELWHEPLEVSDFSTEQLADNDTVGVLAFPFVEKFNWERGLTMGDLEEDKGVQRFSSQPYIPFENKRLVMDLNEIYIENPKFRPGYSGGLVFYLNNGKYMYSGVSMGMTNVVNRGNRRFCLGFYIKAENLRDALFYNF